MSLTEFYYVGMIVSIIRSLVLLFESRKMLGEVTEETLRDADDLPPKLLKGTMAVALFVSLVLLALLWPVHLILETTHWIRSRGKDGEE